MLFYCNFLRPLSKVCLLIINILALLVRNHVFGRSLQSNLVFVLFSIQWYFFQFYATINYWYLGLVPSKDMQTPTAFRSGHIYMKDAHNSESIEKPHFRFFRYLFFELWLIVFTIYGNTSSLPPTKNIKVQKCPNLQKNMRIALTMIF